MKLNCDNCGVEIERRPSMIHRRNYCSIPCRSEGWREHVQPAMSRKARRTHDELTRLGINPAYSPAAQKSRGEKVAISNRKNPRRKSGARDLP